MMALANAGLGDQRSYDEISHYLDLTELRVNLILNFLRRAITGLGPLGQLGLLPDPHARGRFRFLVLGRRMYSARARANTARFR